MDPVLALAVGLAVGLGAGILATHVLYRTKLDALAIQIQNMRDDKDTIKAQFSSLATDALSRSNELFLQMAGEQFGKHHKTASADLESRQQAIKSALEPLARTQVKMEIEIRELEKKRLTAYDELTTTSTALKAQTHRIASALASPTVRGNWGELHLEKVVELAGLKKHITFQTQVAADGIRPDAVVSLPGQREIVIDSKAPLDAFRAAVEAESEEARQAHMKRHVDAVKGHIAKLAKKEYYKQFETVDFVIMFVPVEAAYYAALQAAPDLIESKGKVHVILAGPLTLLSLMKSIAYGWREVEMVKNARKIKELAETFHKRVQTLVRHVHDVGDKLRGTVLKFNGMIGSFDRTLFPQIRKLEDYMATEEGERIDHAKEITDQLRSLNPQDDDEEE